MEEVQRTNEINQFVIDYSLNVSKKKLRDLTNMDEISWFSYKCNVIISSCCKSIDIELAMKTYIEYKGKGARISNDSLLNLLSLVAGLGDLGSGCYHQPKKISENKEETPTFVISTSREFIPPSNIEYAMMVFTDIKAREQAYWNNAEWKNAEDTEESSEFRRILTESSYTALIRCCCVHFRWVDAFKLYFEMIGDVIIEPSTNPSGNSVCTVEKSPLRTKIRTYYPLLAVLASHYDDTTASVPMELKFPLYFTRCQGTSLCFNNTISLLIYIWEDMIYGVDSGGKQYLSDIWNSNRESIESGSLRNINEYLAEVLDITPTEREFGLFLKCIVIEYAKTKLAIGEELLLMKLRCLFMHIVHQCIAYVPVVSFSMTLECLVAWDRLNKNIVSDNDCREILKWHVENLMCEVVSAPLKGSLFFCNSQAVKGVLSHALTIKDSLVQWQVLDDIIQIGAVDLDNKTREALLNQISEFATVSKPRKPSNTKHLMATGKIPAGPMRSSGVAKPLEDGLSQDAIHWNSYNAWLSRHVTPSFIDQDASMVEKCVTRKVPTVIVDGANVGYYKMNYVGAPPHVDYVQITWLLLHLISMGHTPLLMLHARHTFQSTLDTLDSHNLAIIKSWREAGNSSVNTTNYEYLTPLFGNMLYYSTPSGSNDDWYWLYASVKLNCGIVTNDEMRDHHFQMLSPRWFSTWKLCHQVHFTFGEWDVFTEYIRDRMDNKDVDNTSGDVAGTVNTDTKRQRTSTNPQRSPNHYRETVLQLPSKYSLKAQRVGNLYIFPLASELSVKLGAGTQEETEGLWCATTL